MNWEDKSLNILIVEDHDDEYHLLLDCIQNSCISTNTIVHAKSVSQTKDCLLGEHKFDLVFVDLNMNNHPNAEVFLQLMDWADYKLPMVALCEVASPETTLLALVNGAKHFLIKSEYDEQTVEKVMMDCFSMSETTGGYFENREFLGEGIELGAVWDIDLLNHQVKRSGKKFYESLGYSEDDYNKTFDFWEERLHPEDYSRVMGSIQKSLADNTKRYWELEYRFRKADGHYSWVNERGYILNDASGRPFRIIGAIIDINDRKKREGQIQFLDHQLGAYFFHNPYPMWIYDNETYAFLEVNTAAIQKYEYTREEFLQMTLRDIRPAIDLKQLKNLPNDVVSSNPVRHWQVRHQKKNGEIIDVEVTTSDIQFGSKMATNVMVVDITEQIHARNERTFVLEVVEKLRSERHLLDGLNAILKYVREYIQWQYAEIWLTCSSGESIKMIAYDFDETNAIDFQGFADAISFSSVPIEQTVFKRKSKHQKVYWIEDLNSEELFLRREAANRLGLRSAFSVPISYKDNYVAWVVFFNDKFTKKDIHLINLVESICRQLGYEIRRRNSEEQLQYIFKFSRDLMGMANLRGFMTQVNHGFKKVLGYDEQTLISKPIQRFIWEEDWPILQNAIDELHENRVSSPFELRCVAADKSIKWINCTVTQIPTEDLIFVSGRDITSRKKSEEEREILIKELRESNRDLKQFSYITSHNLRAPLSNLLAILDLINPNQVKDEMTLFLLEKFKESTHVLNHTINDLLDILVIKNNVNIEQQSLNLEEELDKSLEQLSYLRKHEEIIQVDFSEGREVYFNATYLESILQNLITNAFKYQSPERKLRLNIYTRDSKGFLKLYFSDNGVGINLKRHRDKIFGLYQRFHDHPDSKGLGLYIINSQVRALGGMIDVQSEEGVGTTFIVSFKK
ncbi:MAG: PAS domain S-box protein [Flectobacillus sp.]|uniref:PAS domain S-box protein n=1 Tax=Flectobacillus sp. TaxID=50419 RepID=UPI003B9D2F86